jgi:hypothetical protein
MFLSVFVAPPERYEAVGGVALLGASVLVEATRIAEIVEGTRVSESQGAEVLAGIKDAQLDDELLNASLAAGLEQARNIWMFPLANVDFLRGY